MDRDKGFTLVELAIVSMILGVLIAIALPNFLGFQKTAGEMQVRAGLSHGAKAEAAILVRDGAYTADAGALEDMVPGIVFGNDADASIRVVVGDVNPGDSQQVLLYARAVSGVWFGLRIVAVGADLGRHTCRSPNEADMTFAFCGGTDW